MRLNGPGTTASGVLAMLAAAGVTQVEPGHGLTGTTPLHAVRDEPELPAALYIGEISHHHGGRAYCYGGGLYIDPVFPPYQVRALVARDGDLASAHRVDADILPPAAIDYYGMLHEPEGVRLEAGASAMFGFRIQAFAPARRSWRSAASPPGRPGSSSPRRGSPRCRGRRHPRRRAP